MLSTRVMPCLLLKDGGLVKTVRFRDPVYVGDPINAVKIFNGKGVDELILLDISATPEKRAPNLRHLADIVSECFMPVCYGGGIRTIEDIAALHKIGIEKVSINTRAVESPDFIRSASGKFGSQSIVASIDVKRNWRGRYTTWSHSGVQGAGVDPVMSACAMESAGAGEILLTSVDRDGTMKGFDLELIKSVTDKVRIPVIACGGAGTLSDISTAARGGGASAVALGSMSVFQSSTRSVLINFPTQDELSLALDEQRR